MLDRILNTPLLNQTHSIIYLLISLYLSITVLNIAKSKGLRTEWWDNPKTLISQELKV